MSNFKYERYENEEGTDQDTRPQETPPAYTPAYSGTNQDGYGNNVPPQQGYGPYSGQQAQQVPYAVPQQPYGSPTPATTFDQTGRVVTSQPVVQQVVVVRPPSLENPPPDYLGLNIFACLCCCWIIGIFGIVMSIAARDAIQRGDEEGAKRNSASAKALAIASILLGVVAIVIVAVLYAVVFNASAEKKDTYSNNYYG